MYVLFANILLFLFMQFVCAETNIVSPISVSGKSFINSITGEPFFVNGIDYQPGGSAGFKAGSDPLSDVEVCARDIALFQTLGFNTVRVYSVDPKLNHDECMTLLAKAGIYLILDVNSPIYGQHLDRSKPKETYTAQYLKHVLSVVDLFSGYNNTLGFIAGNEVIDLKDTNGEVHIYIKALIRDIKNYIDNHVFRHIPVGYAATDLLEYRNSLPAFLECGDFMESIDFYGVNTYRWCGDQTFESSTYDKLIEEYDKLLVPTILTEYGCNAVQPRKFQDIIAMFDPQTTASFAGGLIYEWTQGENNYGLVEVNKDGSVKLRDDFYAAMDQLSKCSLPNKLIDRQKPSTIRCESTYGNLKAKELPKCPNDKILKNGIDIERGSFVKPSILKTKYKVFGNDDKEIKDVEIKSVVDINYENAKSSTSYSSKTTEKGTEKETEKETEKGTDSSNTLKSSKPKPKKSAGSIVMPNIVKLFCSFVIGLVLLNN